MARVKKIAWMQPNSFKRLTNVSKHLQFHNVVYWWCVPPLCRTPYVLSPSPPFRLICFMPTHGTNLSVSSSCRIVSMLTLLQPSPFVSRHSSPSISSASSFTSDASCHCLPSTISSICNPPSKSRPHLSFLCRYRIPPSSSIRYFSPSLASLLTPPFASVLPLLLSI